MTKRERIARHRSQLSVIFPSLTARAQAFDVIGTLESIERRASKLAEDYCNKPLEEGYVERTQASLLDELDRLIGFRAAKVPVFVNLDPRGYALKIEDDYMRAHNVDLSERDWGGYGILSPDFT